MWLRGVACCAAASAFKGARAMVVSASVGSAKSTYFLLLGTCTLFILVFTLYLT